MDLKKLEPFAEKLLEKLKTNAQPFVEDELIKEIMQDKTISDNAIEAEIRLRIIKPDTAIKKPLSEITLQEYIEYLADLLKLKEEDYLFQIRSVHDFAKKKHRYWGMCRSVI